MSFFRMRFRSFSASTNNNYMKSVNENCSTQKNRRERRFFLRKCLFFSVGNNVDLSEMIFWLVLTRATLISTNLAKRYMLIKDMCQCTHTRNTHFYSRGKSIVCSKCGVSMPSHGQHSFLLYPLKCPCFMRIIDPIFAGNSQNILKKAFFRGFTCMFTVCSYLSIRLVFTMPSASKSIISYFS